MKEPKQDTERIICFKVTAVPSQKDKEMGVEPVTIIVPATSIARLYDDGITEHAYTVEFQSTHDFGLDFVPEKMEAFIDKMHVLLLN